MVRLRVLEECRPRIVSGGRDVGAYAPLFSALGDETRLEILAVLVAARGPLCMCDLETRFDVSQATLARHLQVLRKAGLLVSERRGPWNYYAVHVAALARIEAFTRAIGAR